MTTRGEINSNFYQIVNVDANGAPTSVKPEYIPAQANANFANYANYANFAGNAYSVDVANVVGIGNIATINLDGNSGNILYGNGVFSAVPDVGNANSANYANYANFAGTVITNAQPNITSVGTLTSLDVTGNITSGDANLGNLAIANFFSGDGSLLTNINGANVSAVANANYANFAGQVVDATQSNITTLGTLTEITVSGNSNLGNVGNVHITGGTNGYVLQTDGAGNLTWTAQTGGGGNGTVAGANTEVQFNDAGSFGAVSGFTFDKVTEILTVGNISANGSLLTNINGANVSAVANANYANFAGTAYSVAGANVSGEVANANYATFAGTAYSVSGANVSGEVANANYATYSGNANYANFAGTAYSVSGANVSGQVGNALVAGTVYTNAQSNITSVGTLTDLTVEGNIIGNTHLYVGYGANSTGLSNPTIIAKAADSEYIQSAIVNSSSLGSADLVAYGDNGSDNEAWIDLGFTGSLFNDANYTLTKPNDGYVFVQGDAGNVKGGNLIFATGDQGSTKDIVFATGGFQSADEKMRFIHANSQFYIEPTTAATSNITGALRVAGGIGVAGNVYSTGNITGANANLGNLVTANYFSGDGSLLTGITATATLPISAGNSNINIVTNANIDFSVTGTANVMTISNTSANVNGNIQASRFISNIATGTAPFTVTSTTTVANLSVATSQSAGTLGYTGRTSNTTVHNIPFTTASPANGSVSNGFTTYVNSSNFTYQPSTGTVTATTFVGALTGAATTAGTVTNNAQPNITSVGTLSSLAVTGNISSGNANLGNLATANFFSGNGSLLTGITATTGNANYANYAGNAFSVTGSNVSGQVGNALIAGTVYDNAQPNITSVGTLSSLSVTGNITSGNATLGNLTISNYFSGDGSLLTGITATTGNANYANYAGNAFSVTGSNVSGAVAYATTANSVAGANVSGQVGNALIAGTVYTNAQPNITSVGTLSNLNVSGQIVSTQTGNASDNGGQLFLNGSGNNRIDFNTNGTGAPTDTTRSSGTKIVLYPALSSTQTDYAMGIDAATMWSSVPVNSSSFKFKWYGNTTEIANLDGTGNFIVAGNISSGNANLGNLTISNYFSGNGSLLTGITAIATPAGSNTQVQFNNAGLLGASANLTFDNVTNTLTATNFVGNGSGLTSITGANVSGQVSNALIAGTVYTNAQPNITSVGTLTSLDVATGILTGNVPFEMVQTWNNVSATFVGLRFNTTNNASASGSKLFDVQSNTVSQFTVYANGVSAAGSLNVSGVSNLNSVSNVIITGGSANYVLQTNGSGNLSWVAQSGGGGSTATDFTPSLLLGGM